MAMGKEMSEENSNTPTDESRRSEGPGFRDEHLN